MCCRAGARLSLTLLNSTELRAKAPEGEVVAPGDLWCVCTSRLTRYIFVSHRIARNYCVDFAQTSYGHILTLPYAYSNAETTGVSLSRVVPGKGLPRAPSW
jgi:hypothetical protein